MTFTIRVVCDPDDADRITAALAAALRTGAPRRYPSRDRMRVRLYLTAELPNPEGTPA